MKIGDKVKVFSNKNGSSVCNMRIGQIGTLVNIDDNCKYPYSLEFDTVYYGSTTAAFDISEIKKVDDLKKVYILVRKTEDIEMNTVDVFNGVFIDLDLAEKTMGKYKEDFGGEYEIIEREI